MAPRTAQTTQTNSHVYAARREVLAVNASREPGSGGKLSNWERMGGVTVCDGVRLRATYTNSKFQHAQVTESLRVPVTNCNQQPPNCAQLPPNRHQLPPLSTTPKHQYQQLPPATTTTGRVPNRNTLNKAEPGHESNNLI